MRMSKHLAERIAKNVKLDGFDVDADGVEV